MHKHANDNGGSFCDPLLEQAEYLAEEAAEIERQTKKLLETAEKLTNHHIDGETPMTDSVDISKLAPSELPKHLQRELAAKQQTVSEAMVAVGYAVHNRECQEYPWSRFLGPTQSF